MKLSYTPLVALIALLGVYADTAVEKLSCTNYTKGKFEPQTITDQETCQTACQIAEGLPIGRFNTGESSDYVLCYCINQDQSGKTTDTRDLCEDGTKSSGGTAASVIGFTSAAVAVAVNLVAMASM
eukprot:CAMPEP_0170759042 /NCGR_PEP_ID=MMETSP0733-20121128/682_1 /TAXON_ID=186038 /ORGANISM="Fragilariopsis kerguelensis, Strain L26-C5" /LENGTH=125 /DNA_ID=CAMNT_0011098443 /DNA_START=192 /DNA_END=569 /DNA_ORIENTATION=-